MEKEEWQLWQEYLPEVSEWLAESSAQDRPSWTACLEALEMRALALKPEQADHFLAIASNWKLPRLPDADLSLFLRIMINFKSGRCGELSMKEFARLVFVTARRRSQISQDYLDAFEMKFITSM